jgi:hypothetical protein
MIYCSLSGIMRTIHYGLYKGALSGQPGTGFIFIVRLSLTRQHPFFTSDLLPALPSHVTCVQHCCSTNGKPLDAI